MSEGVLRQVERWQRAIASHLADQNPDLSLIQLNHQTQNWILSLLGLRLCEQYHLIALGQLQALQGEIGVDQQLQQLLQQVNTQYSALLPQPEPTTGAIADALLHPILKSIEQWTEAIGIEILGQAYERCLSQFDLTVRARNGKPQTQKHTGSYYTPTAIVNNMIHGVLRHLPTRSHSTPITILDPACGGGAFLLAAYQQLLQCQPYPLSYEQRKELLLNSFFGVDIDPQAIAVTKLSLYLQLLIGEAKPCTTPLPDLSQNIVCGNAIMGLDWSEAFPVATKAGGFDVVVGNPPYLDSEWMTVALPEWRRYCAHHYQTAVGNWDLFCVFIEKGLELCRQEGLMSFVVPNKLASAAYAAETRSLLTRDNQLLSIHDYSQASAFSVAVYPLVVTVQKTVSQCPAPVEFSIMQMSDRHPIVERLHPLDYALYADHPQKPWLIPTLHHTIDWLTQLSHQFPPLADVAQVTGAATVAEAYAMRSLLQNQPTPQAGDLRMVNSGTLDRYRWLWGEKPLRYLGASYLYPVIVRSHTKQLPKTRWHQATQPKIIVAGMTRQLECALDSTGSILAGKSTSVVRSTLDLRYLLAVLNSPLIHLYFVSRFGGNRLQGGYLRVGPPQLKQLPMCIPDVSKKSDRNLYHHLLELVDQRLALPAQRVEEIRAIEQAINWLIYRFYALTDTAINSLEEWEKEYS